MSEHKPRWIEGPDKDIPLGGGGAYGRVVQWNDELQKNLPIICGHGGSMWLCWDCAESIVRTDSIVTKPCPHPEEYLNETARYIKNQKLDQQVADAFKKTHPWWKRIFN